MKNFFSNLHARGSAMIQAMVVAGVVMGLGAYMLGNQEVQEKVRISTSSKNQKNIFIREISEALADHETCFHTLNSAGPLSNGMVLPQINSKTNSLMYKVDSKLGNEKISDLKLYSFNPSGAMKYNAAQLRITLSTTLDSDKAGYGGRDLAYSIPIFLITENNKVSFCTADPTGGVKEALKKSCQELEGSFNETSGACENLHGPQGAVLKRMRSYLCTTSPGTCQHPFANAGCTGTDIRGVAYGNWVVTALGSAPSLSCACIPRTCKNPASVCAGVDLGTNYCQAECGVGSMDCSCSWSTGAWSACVNGTQSRTVVPVDKDGNLPKDMSYCGGAPVNEQPCSVPPAAENFTWKQSGIGACSMACGPGVQNHLYECINKGGQSVADSKCTTPKPATSQSCTGNSCGFAWKIKVDWGSCSSTVCGTPGSQKRDVVCIDNNNLAEVAETNCNAASKPDTTQTCGTSCGFAWIADSWGTCAPLCSLGNSGLQTRAVRCQNTTNNTEEPDHAKCTDAKPPMSQSCTNISDSSFTWVTGSLSPCNYDCNVGSAGTQTRPVECKGDCSGSVVADSSCTGAKPDSTFACSGSCSYEWRGLGFGSCSNTCGPGSQTQDVKCFNVATNAEVSDGLCTMSKPASTQSCTGTSCSDCMGTPKSWSQGSNTCDGNLAQAIHGATSTATDSTVPSQGSVSFSCNNGAWVNPTGETCQTGCRVLHPIGWHANGTNCAEYPNPPHIPFTETFMYVGEEIIMNAGYVSSPSHSTGWGRAKSTCLPNGNIQVDVIHCEAGAYEP